MCIKYQIQCARPIILATQYDICDTQIIDNLEYALISCSILWYTYMVVNVCLSNEYLKFRKKFMLGKLTIVLLHHTN